MDPLEPEDESVLQAFYGTKTRFQRARDVFCLVKAVTKHLACVIPFAPTWRLLICTEWLAHSRLEDHIGQKLYRDHIFHPAAVAMLGWELLSSIPHIMRYPATQRLEARFARDYDLSTSPDHTWRAVLENAWLVAGFFHDHCYPRETLAKCEDAMKKQHPFLAADMLEPFQRKARTAWRKGCFRQDPPKLLRPVLRESKHSHAALGALALYSLREAAPNDFARAVVDLAADAVLWHHATGKGTDYQDRRAPHFAFQNHPLRYLLVLCDGLHEFCRELLLRRERNDGEFVTSFLDSCKHAELEVKDTEIRITYHINCSDLVCGSRWKLGPSPTAARGFKVSLISVAR
jgi:hypothetical protein